MDRTRLAYIDTEEAWNQVVLSLFGDRFDLVFPSIPFRQEDLEDRVGRLGCEAVLTAYWLNYGGLCRYDGGQLADQLHILHPDLPVFVITDRGDDIYFDQPNTRLVKGKEYLVEPVLTEWLAAAIEHAVKQNPTKK